MESNKIHVPNHQPDYQPLLTIINPLFKALLTHEITTGYFCEVALRHSLESTASETHVKRLPLRIAIRNPPTVMGMGMISVYTNIHTQKFIYIYIVYKYN